MGQINKIGDVYYIEFYARGLMYSQLAGNDYHAAQELLVATEAKIAAGEALTIVRNIELPAFFNQLKQEISTTFQAKTCQRFNQLVLDFEHFLKKNHSQLLFLSQITPSVIESYKLDLCQRLTNKKAVNLSLLLLRDVLEYGIKWGFINDNPTIHVRLLSMPVKDRILTHRAKQVKELFLKQVGLAKISRLLNISDVARLMYYATWVPLSRSDITK